MTASTPGASANPGASPDAVGRGVLGHDPEGELVLFVLAGHSLGSTPVGADAAPTWLDLRRLLNLDAVGEPVDSRIAIEATFDGGMTLEALWPEPFCDQVTDRLRELLDTGMMIPEGADPADEPARADAGAGPAAATESFPASTTEPGLWSHDDERPLPGEGPPLSRSDGPGGTGELRPATSIVWRTAIPAWAAAPRRGWPTVWGLHLHGRPMPAPWCPPSSGPAPRLRKAAKSC